MCPAVSSPGTTQSLPLPRFGANNNSHGVKVQYNIGNEKYLLEHSIDGRPLMPAASYIYTAWQALREHARLSENAPVRLSDVTIHQAVQIDETSIVNFNVNFGAGPRHHFEIVRGEERVVSGDIEVLEEKDLEHSPSSSSPSSYHSPSSE